jgi:hypothetical protein
MANTKVRPAKQREFMEALAAPDQTERIMEAKFRRQKHTSGYSRLGRSGYVLYKK